jgi:hypothetical protein
MPESLPKRDLPAEKARGSVKLRPPVTPLSQESRCNQENLKQFQFAQNSRARRISLFHAAVGCMILDVVFTIVMRVLDQKILGTLLSKWLPDGVGPLTYLTGSGVLGTILVLGLVFLTMVMIYHLVFKEEENKKFSKDPAALFEEYFKVDGRELDPKTDEDKDEIAKKLFYVNTVLQDESASDSYTLEYDGEGLRISWNQRPEKEAETKWEGFTKGLENTRTFFMLFFLTFWIVWAVASLVTGGTELVMGDLSLAGNIGSFIFLAALPFLVPVVLFLWPDKKTQNLKLPEAPADVQEGITRLAQRAYAMGKIPGAIKLQDKAVGQPSPAGSPNASSANLLNLNKTVAEPVSDLTLPLPAPSLKPPERGEIFRHFVVIAVRLVCFFEFLSWSIMSFISHGFLFHGEALDSDSLKSVLGNFSHWGVGVAVLGGCFLWAVYNTYHWNKTKKEEVIAVNKKEAAEVEAEAAQEQGIRPKSLAELEAENSEKRMELALLKRRIADPKKGVDLSLASPTIEEFLNPIDPKVKRTQLFVAYTFSYLAVGVVVITAISDALFQARDGFWISTGIIDGALAVIRDAFGIANDFKLLGPFGVAMSIALVLGGALLYGLMVARHDRKETADKKLMEQREHEPEIRRFLEAKSARLDEELAQAYQAYLEEESQSLQPTSSGDLSALFPEPDFTNTTRKQEKNVQFMYRFAGFVFYSIFVLAILSFIPSLDILSLAPNILEATSVLVPLAALFLWYRLYYASNIMTEKEKAGVQRVLAALLVSFLGLVLRYALPLDSAVLSGLFLSPVLISPLVLTVWFLYERKGDPALTPFPRALAAKQAYDAEEDLEKKRLKLELLLDAMIMLMNPMDRQQKDLNMSTWLTAESAREGARKQKLPSQVTQPTSAAAEEGEEVMAQGRTVQPSKKGPEAFLQDLVFLQGLRLRLRGGVVPPSEIRQAHLTKVEEIFTELHANANANANAKANAEASHAPVQLSVSEKAKKKIDLYSLSFMVFFAFLVCGLCALPALPVFNLPLQILWLPAVVAGVFIFGFAAKLAANMEPDMEPDMEKVAQPPASPAPQKDGEKESVPPAGWKKGARFLAGILVFLGFVAFIAFAPSLSLPFIPARWIAAAIVLPLAFFPLLYQFFDPSAFAQSELKKSADAYSFRTPTKYILGGLAVPIAAIGCVAGAYLLFFLKLSWEIYVLSVLAAVAMGFFLGQLSLKYAWVIHDAEGHVEEKGKEGQIFNPTMRKMQETLKKGYVGFSLVFLAFLVGFSISSFVSASSMSLFGLVPIGLRVALFAVALPALLYMSWQFWSIFVKSEPAVVPKAQDPSNRVSADVLPPLFFAGMQFICLGGLGKIIQGEASTTEKVLVPLEMFSLISAVTLYILKEVGKDVPSAHFFMATFLAVAACRELAALYTEIEAADPHVLLQQRVKAYLNTAEGTSRKEQLKKEIFALCHVHRGVKESLKSARMKICEEYKDRANDSEEDLRKNKAVEALFDGFSDQEDATLEEKEWVTALSGVQDTKKVEAVLHFLSSAMIAVCFLMEGFGYNFLSAGHIGTLARIFSLLAVMFKLPGLRSFGVVLSEDRAIRQEREAFLTELFPAGDENKPTSLQIVQFVWKRNNLSRDWNKMPEKFTSAELDASVDELRLLYRRCSGNEKVKFVAELKNFAAKAAAEAKPVAPEQEPTNTPSSSGSKDAADPANSASSLLAGYTPSLFFSSDSALRKKVLSNPPHP